MCRARTDIHTHPHTCLHTTRQHFRAPLSLWPCHPSLCDLSVGTHVVRRPYRLPPPSLPPPPGALSSLNPAVKLEAARAILRASRLARKGAAATPGAGAASSSSSSQPIGRLRLVGEVPPSTAAAAIEVGGTCLPQPTGGDATSSTAHTYGMQLPPLSLLPGKTFGQLSCYVHGMLHKLAHCRTLPRCLVTHYLLIPQQP